MTKYWKDFIKEYCSDITYWYVPKGMAVKPQNVKILQKKLEILKSFEGKNWGKYQSRYVGELIKRNLFERRAKKHQTEQDAAAIGRMIKVVMSLLGLAWVDKASNVLVTSTGNKFIRSKNPDSIIEKQLRKYQFYNPTFAKNAFRKIKVFPHILLLKILLRMSDFSIDHNEYILFVSRAKSDADIDNVCDQIERYRNLTQKQQRALTNILDRKSIITARQQALFNGDEIKHNRRTSIFNTITLNSSYAIDFLTYPHYVECSKEGISVKSSAFKQIKRIIELHNSQAIYIDFKTQLDWFAYYGDYQKDSSYLNALEYYEDTFDIHKAVDTFRLAQKAKLISAKETEHDYIEGRITEKMLEDFLEYNLHCLENGLVLTPKGRQYRTPVGSIDLLARDNRGKYVVIELKKGRTSDRVLGQLGRYIGWVKENLYVKKKQVRGIIVGKEIDRKMMYAMKGYGLTSSFCKIKTFNFYYKFVDVKY